jgi:hypothetical protein
LDWATSLLGKKITEQAQQITALAEETSLEPQKTSAMAQKNLSPGASQHISALF